MKRSDDDPSTTLSELDGDARLRLIDFALDGAELPISDEMLKRVEARVQAKISQAPGSDRAFWSGACKPASSIASRKRTVAAIGIASVLVLVGAAFGAPIYAAIRAAWDYIPNIGGVASAHGPVLELPEPKSLQWNGSAVTVNGIVLTDDSMEVELSGTGSDWPHTVEIATAQGAEYRMSGYSVSSAGRPGVGGGAWNGVFGAKGQFHFAPKSMDVGVVLGVGSGRRQLVLELQPAGRVTRLGPTAFHHGIQITAISSRINRGAAVTLIPRENNRPYQITNLVPIMPSGAPDLRIVDDHGHGYPGTLEDNVTGDTEIAFRPSASVDQYRIILPQIAVEYPASMNVSLPVPGRGSLKLHHMVNVGGMRFEVVEVQRLWSRSQGFMAKIDLNMTAGNIGDATPYQLDLAQSWQSRQNAHGVSQWLELSIGAHQRTVTLHLTGLQAFIKGPWQFSVRLPQR